MSHTTSSLRYRLIDGPACLAPLRVVDTCETEWHGWHVVFYVLGASHAVRLERDRACITELLTCAAPGGAARSLLEADAADIASLSAAAHGLRCAIRASVRPLEEGDDLRMPCDASSRLESPFPAADSTVQAWTRIGWCADGASLLVETVHTYPEEGLAVRSESMFEEDAQ